MIKSTPQQLALDLLDRSICSVQVAAVVFDAHGIVGWGWNSMGGDGYGECAEISAIRRSNRRRLGGSTCVVVGRRKRNHKTVIAFPCANCYARLVKVGIKTIHFQDKASKWHKVKI